MINERNNFKAELLKKSQFVFFAKDIVKRMIRHATDWEDVFAKNISDKRLLAKIYKEF